MVTLSKSTSETTKEIAWHQLEINEVLSLLFVNAQSGLKSDRIDTLLSQYGNNQLTAKPGKPWWWKFLLQFNQPILYILLIAGGTKALLGEFVNAGVIWGVTTTNALISFIQESKAEGAIAALAQAVTTEATIIRDGQKIRISSTELVPGDIVLLVSGDKVPADLRLIKVRDLQINESALTGESLAVTKSVATLPLDTALGDRLNMAYGGGLVSFGQGIGVVVATGNNTETGKISQLMEQHINLATPLTRKFNQFIHKWLYVVISLATLTFLVGWRFKGIKEALEAAVALTVGAIPEGLPAVITITLAIGVSRMAKRHAILRKLPAVETLGSATVICSDKTGTLTENQMTVQQIFAGRKNYRINGTGYQSVGEILQGGKLVDIDGELALQECLIAGLLCNDSHLEHKQGQWVVIGDPTEGALIVSANKGGFAQSDLNRRMPRLDSIPFESDYQYMATLHQTSIGKIIYLKGSVEAILSRSADALNSTRESHALDRVQIEQQVAHMAEQGLRVLAMAKLPVSDERTNLNHEDLIEGLTFIGLQGSIDPPRYSATQAVKVCQQAGIKIKMITGDHPLTASAIAKKMGIQHSGSVIAYTGSELEAMNPQELERAVEIGSVFARVAPEQKLRLVEALQLRGEIVAMTGDGVNDAPALKQADIGIAMGTGTEVAKEAADMLLTDDNFASIEAAVEEGRAVYQNIVKAISFILPVNGGESMTILLSTLLVRDLPILSLQILWLNMLNSITMTVPLAFEPKSERVMQQPPRDPNESLLSRRRWGRIIAISLFNWILIFGVFEYTRANTGDLAVARTMAINALVAGRIFYLLSISQLIPSFLDSVKGKTAKMTKIPAIAWGIIGAIMLQIAFAHVPIINSIFFTAPLSLNQWLFCLAVGSPMIIWSAIVNRFDPPN